MIERTKKEQIGQFMDFLKSGRKEAGRQAFADCPAWPLPPQGLTPESKRWLPSPSTICPAI